jgi:fatty acid desaturase
MAGASKRPEFGSPELNRAMMALRRVDGWRNLAYLLVDYLTLIAVVGGAIAFAEGRRALGLGWWWNVPVFALAIALVGGVQHRLAALGHEASHYTFLKNKFLNDLVPDVFCMFPLTSSVHHYRLLHMAHHQYVNHPEHDPDLRNMARVKGTRPPMSHWRFVREHHLRVLLSPASIVRYLRDYFRGNVLGLAESVYVRRAEGDSAPSGVGGLRLATALGIVYVVAIDAAFIALERVGHAPWIGPAGVAGYALALGVIACLPARSFFATPFRQPYSPRVGAALRLGFFTAVLMALNGLRGWTGGRSTIYFSVLWMLPMATSFMYYMLLREVYQHGNTEEDRITNTRVFRVDPFTRWAVFVHGQDWHTPHHLFPAVPHYNLERLHKLLKAHNRDYAERVIEVEGTFANRSGRPTILDEMTRDPAAPRGATEEIDGGQRSAISGQFSAREEGRRSGDNKPRAGLRLPLADG